MKFFLDNTLPPRLARALQELVKEDRHTVTHLREKFSADTPDVTWISRLAEEGEWIIISGDMKILRSHHEQKAWRESRLTAFFLKSGWTNHGLWDQVWRLVRFCPDIVNQARQARTGAGFVININGKIAPL